jgi:hypothetical protein
VGDRADGATPHVSDTMGECLSSGATRQRAQPLRIVSLRYGAHWLVVARAVGRCAGTDMCLARPRA